MSDVRHSVRVLLGGEELVIRSEAPPEYTQAVARHFDEVLSRIRGSMPTVEAGKAALLAGLAVTDELFQARRGDEDLAARIAKLATDLTRLLPPAKRGRSSEPAVSAD